jgi:hypothetical protein
MEQEYHYGAQDTDIADNGPRAAFQTPKDCCWTALGGPTNRLFRQEDAKHNGKDNAEIENNQTRRRHFHPRHKETARYYRGQRLTLLRR